MPVRNLLTNPPHLPLIAPSILSADFADLGADSRAALDAGGDLLHVDVMDGHFAPNLTMGPALVRSLRAALPDTFLDVHMMVTDPAIFVASFAAAGADHFTFHIEADAEPVALVAAIHDAGMTAGLAINPPTPVERILPTLDAFDMILVMSVNPGFSGQSFIESVLDKTRAIAPHLRDDQRLEMDGGIDVTNAGACRDAGCDVIASASAIFGAPDQHAAVAALRGSNHRAPANH